MEFECWLTGQNSVSGEKSFRACIRRQMKILYEKLLMIILEEPEGSIRIYRLCIHCEKQIQTIGIKNQVMTEEEEKLFII